MNTLLQDLLAQRPYLVADGAMGTNLFRLGLETGAAPELWNVEHAERVAAVHRGFVEAGADILLTNTFGANRYRLKLHDAQARVRELVVACRIARAATAAVRSAARAGARAFHGLRAPPAASRNPLPPICFLLLPRRAGGASEVRSLMAVAGPPTTC